MTRWIGGFMLGAAVALVYSGCVGTGYRRVTVISMAMIFEPDNLSTDAQCRALWRDVARFGVQMDRARNDWNEVVLEAATALIERGCVQRPIE